MEAWGGVPTAAGTTCGCVPVAGGTATPAGGFVEAVSSSVTAPMFGQEGRDTGTCKGCTMEAGVAGAVVGDCGGGRCTMVVSGGMELVAVGAAAAAVGCATGV